MTLYLKLIASQLLLQRLPLNTYTHTDAPLLPGPLSPLLPFLPPLLWWQLLIMKHKDHARVAVGE